MKRLLLNALVLMGVYTTVRAQQWQGIHGLIHTPNAEMDSVGELRVGMHVINKEMLPQVFSYEDEKGNLHRYNTLSYYLNATPFPWLTFSYACVMFRTSDKTLKGFKKKDRHISARARVLKEKRHTPAIALGMDDILDSFEGLDSGEYTFGNLYGVATKHFEISRHQFGLTLGYRQYKKSTIYRACDNRRFNGAFGGLSYQPSVYRNLRFMGEFDGLHVNLGADVHLWSHLFLQVSLMDCKYPSAGICFSHDLFSR